MHMSYAKKKKKRKYWERLEQKSSGCTEEIQLHCYTEKKNFLNFTIATIVISILIILSILINTSWSHTATAETRIRKKELKEMMMKRKLYKRLNGTNWVPVVKECWNSEREKWNTTKKKKKKNKLKKWNLKIVCIRSKWLHLSKTSQVKSQCKR